jgi:hypothetical protein
MQKYIKNCRRQNITMAKYSGPEQRHVLKWRYREQQNIKMTEYPDSDPSHVLKWRHSEQQNIKMAEYPGPDLTHVLKCQSCYNPITSTEHEKKCSTCLMFGYKVYEIPEIFKPIMTYGLGGCTVLLMVFFDKNTNKVIKVVFCHDPVKETILEYFDKYYTSDYNIVTIIKTPGEFHKDGKKWIQLVINQKYWASVIPKYNCKLILEPYNLCIDLCDKTKFKSSLYFKMQPGPQYSDNSGKYIDIDF